MQETDRSWSEAKRCIDWVVMPNANAQSERNGIAEH